METEIKPVAQPPRRQPFSVCEKMKKVIEHLRDRATVHTSTRQIPNKIMFPRGQNESRSPRQQQDATAEQGTKRKDESIR